MHFGNELQINDAGYLVAQQHELRALAGEPPLHRSAEASRYCSKDWRWRVSTDYNDHGRLLNHQFRMSRESRLRNGSYEYAQINVNSAGVDDLLTRGNGVAELPPNFNTLFRVRAPPQGQLGLPHRSCGISSGGLVGQSTSSVTASNSSPPTSSAMRSTCTSACLASRTPDWLVWQRENLIGSFDGRGIALQRRLQLDRSSNRQELRLKLQAIAD